MFLVVLCGGVASAQGWVSNGARFFVPNDSAALLAEWGAYPRVEHVGKTHQSTLNSPITRIAVTWSVVGKSGCDSGTIQKYGLWEDLSVYEWGPPVAGTDEAWAAFVACTGWEDPLNPDPEEPVDPEDLWQCDGLFCWRTGVEGEPFEYLSTCDGGDQRQHMNPGSLTEAYYDCQNSQQEPSDPLPVDPGATQDAPACTGADGIACEDTQRDIRQLTGEIRDLLQAEADRQRETPPDPGEPDVDPITTPHFPDLTGPLDGTLTLPDDNTAWRDDLEARVVAAYGRVTTKAAGKMPFGLGSWIPVVSAGGPGGGCEDINITLLGTTQALGWCSSPMYTMVTTGGRAAILVLVMIGFYLATARTVAWA